MKTTRPWGLPRQTLDLFLVRDKKVARTPYEIYERFDISPGEYRADGKLYQMSNKIAETIYIRGTTGWINGLVYRFSDRWVGTVSFAFNPRKRSGRATTLYADRPLLVYWFQSKNNALTQPSSRSTMDVTYTWQNCGSSARPNAVFHPPRWQQYLPNANS